MFERVLAQEAAKATVGRMLQSQRVPFGLLLYGPPAVGKYTLARELASHLNCLRPGTLRCDCPSCKKINQNMHPDVREIRPNEQGTITVDAIRDLIKAFGYKLNEGKRKVCIIRSAHSMNMQASNALLKVLEEPPGEATLVLTSNRMERLFETIRSRCQLVRFGFLPDSVLQNLLERDAQPCDGASIELLAGSYRPGQLPDSLNLLRELWRGGIYQADQPKMDSEPLAKELRYSAACLTYMMRHNLYQFKEFELRRVPMTNVARLIVETDQAVYMLFRGVRPFLVLRYYENRVRELIYDAN